uniref:Protein FMC1 homolog n=2 Tax=Spodoptera frugiperda TaxID=7108 RepID=A0A2H1WIH6_SPOFR
MSKPELDSDGFQKVKSKRISKNKPTKIPSRDIQFDKLDPDIDVEKTIQRIYCAVEDLRLSSYLEDVIKSVSSILKDRKVVEIVCLGLGHVAECIKMASISTKPALVTLRQLLSELRKQSSASKLAENQMVQYIFREYRKYQTTDQQLCKAADEMHFRAKSYYDYLHHSRRYKEINAEFKGKGERSVEETARMVGFKMPHEPKP